MAAHLKHRNSGIAVVEQARDSRAGVAGLCAALAAAETGASVILVEQSNCLGGTATAGMMTLFYTPYRCAHGIPKRIFDRLIAAGGHFPAKSSLSTTRHSRLLPSRWLRKRKSACCCTHKGGRATALPGCPLPC
jgi:glycine/D-amino acid oxidase-like deaminating enzyme